MRGEGGHLPAPASAAVSTADTFVSDPASRSARKQASVVSTAQSTVFVMAAPANSYRIQPQNQREACTAHGEAQVERHRQPPRVTQPREGAILAGD